MDNDGIEDITPEGAACPVYLDPTPLPVIDEPVDEPAAPTVVISPDGTRWALVAGEWVPTDD